MDTVSIESITIPYNIPDPKVVLAILSTRRDYGENKYIPFFQYDELRVVTPFSTLSNLIWCC